jgi:hypothetical protein
MSEQTPVQQFSLIMIDALSGCRKMLRRLILNRWKWARFEGILSMIR